MDSKPTSKLSYCKGVLHKLFSESIRALSGGRHRSCLPIRLPRFLEIISEDDPVYSLLQEILNRTFLNIYALDKTLLQWDSTGSRSTSNRVNDVEKPQIFGTSLHLDHVADAAIATKIRILYNLRHSLVVFLSQVYMEIDNFGKTLSFDSDKSTLGSLLVTVNGCFSNLEASICTTGVDSISFDNSLNYDEPWIDDNTRDAITLIYENQTKLDMYISTMVSKYSKPRKITQHWMCYTVGAIGVTLFSVWVIRSGIVDKWVLGTKNIFSEEQALKAVRIDLLENMRNRQKEATEQLQSTSNSLHSMLLDITERINGEKYTSNVSDHAMLEMATACFEEQLRHPVRNFIWGELPRLTLIQILKKTLDIEASKCELQQEMLMDAEKTSAMLSSLPTICISFGVLMISSAWVKQIKSEGKSARVQRRLLVKELEERIMELQNFQLLNEHGQYINGMVLYTLDRLYRAVERHAKATGEWPWVRQDITYLGDPYLTTPEKLTVTTRLKEMYRCLFPLTRQELIECIDN